MIFPELFEEAVTGGFAVENHGQAGMQRISKLSVSEGRDVFEKLRDDVAGEGGVHAFVDGFADYEKGLAEGVVDPVVGDAAEAEFFAGDIAAGEFGAGAVVEADMAIDIEETGEVIGGVVDPAFGELEHPGAAGCFGAHGFDFEAEGFDFGDTVEAEEAAELAGVFEAELLVGLDPQQGHEGEGGDDVHDVVVAARQGEVLGEEVEEADGFEGGQGAEDAAVFEVACGFEADAGAGELADGSGEAFVLAVAGFAHGTRGGGGAAFGFAVGDARRRGG